METSINQEDLSLDAKLRRRQVQREKILLAAQRANRQKCFPCQVHMGSQINQPEACGSKACKVAH